MKSAGAIPLALAILFVPSALFAGQPVQKRTANLCHSTPVDEGCGALTLPDGTIYFGLFHKGIMDGPGNAVFADNSLLEGNFIRASAAPSDAIYTPAGGQRIAGKYQSQKATARCWNPYAYNPLRSSASHHKVTLAYDVDEFGHVMSAAIEQPDPSPLFEALAVDQVKKCRFEPATVDGKPVKTVSNIVMQFTNE